MFRRIVARVHKAESARNLAKTLFRGVAKRQPFYGGSIYCDMVEHSWAWVHGPRYESFDRELQEALLLFSLDAEALVDVGCNVGAMALSVLLRNPDIHAICVDPNPNAVKLLRKSLARNGLTSRTKVIRAAVSTTGQPVRFDFGGSVTGHVSDRGILVPTIRLVEILSELLPQKRTLLKIDIEGFETLVLPTLAEVGDKTTLTLFVELHPLGMNGAGNPSACCDSLRKLGANLYHLDGTDFTSADDAACTQLVARWIP